MNNEIETVGDLIAALQRFDATLPVRYKVGHFMLRAMSPKLEECPSSYADDADVPNPLERGDEYVAIGDIEPSLRRLA